MGKKKIIAGVVIAALASGGAAIVLPHFGYKLAPKPEIVGRITGNAQSSVSGQSTGTSCPKEEKPTFQECITRNGKLEMWDAYKTQGLYQFQPVQRNGKCFISFSVFRSYRLPSGRYKDEYLVTECPME